MRPKAKQAAIEAVASNFRATWEEGEDPPDAYVKIAGRRIAIEVTTVRHRTVDGTDLTRPRLRFDKVVFRVIARLQAALHEAVPDGTTVILTITAPIRLPTKTAAALEEKIRTCLAEQRARVKLRDAIHGNQIRLRLVRSGWRGASKVIGYVHNPDSDPEVLLEMTHSLLKRIGAAAGKRVPAGFTGDRWLVIANEGGLSHVQTYRQVYSQLSIPTDFKKIMMLLANGRVESLSG